MLLIRTSSMSFSPLQWIYWYDKPSVYRGEPEIEFFRRVPTVWDETRVVHGEIGKYATIARRQGDDWFVGTINNSEKRTLSLKLAFLNRGKRSLANIYADDPSVDTATHVRIDRRAVDAGSTLDIPLMAGGGQAIWISAVD